MSKKKTISYLIFYFYFFLFSIFFYKWFYFEGIKNNYYNIYILFIGILLLFSFFSFFISNYLNLLFNIINISIFITFYLFETYLSFKHIKTYKEKEIYKRKINFNFRDKRTVYNDLKDNDNSLVVNIGTYLYFDISKKYNFFPFSGISQRNTLHCNENGYYSKYTSDRFGFNNPDSEWDRDKIEFLLVGDSFVHGNCVNRPNDIASTLRSISKKTALNLGYDGNRGPLIYYATLREYLRPNVKNILFFYYEGNDIRDLENEIKSKILNQYLYNEVFSQHLIQNQNKIDSLAFKILDKEINKVEKNKKIKVKKELFSLKKYIKLTKTRLAVQNILFPKDPKLQDEFNLILKKTKELAIKNNSNLYFVYLPQYSRFNKQYNGHFENYYLQIKKIVKNLNISFIDIYDLLKKTKEPQELFALNGDGHYNINGYKKVSELIYKHINN